MAYAFIRLRGLLINTFISWQDNSNFQDSIAGKKAR